MPVAAVVLVVVGAPQLTPPEQPHWVTAVWPQAPQAPLSTTPTQPQATPPHRPLQLQPRPVVLSPPEPRCHCKSSPQTQ